MLVLLVAAVLSSCNKYKFTIPVNTGTIRFSQNAYSIDRNAPQPTTVVLPLSLPLEQDATALVTIDASSTALSSQYTIDPLIPAEGIKLSLVKGATQVSFNIASLENFEGDVTVVLNLSTATGGVTISNTNATTTITIHGKPIVLPAIVSSVPNLPSFDNVVTGTTSTSQSYTVSGVKLTSNITLLASSSYKLSLDNVTFTSSATIGFAAANTAPVTVYVVFAPNTGSNVGISGDITMSSGTVPSVKVTLSGAEVGNAVSGILIMKDDFSYGATAGAITATSSGAWSAYSATGANASQYVTAGLSFTGYAGSGVGGALVSQNYKASAEDVSWSFTAQTSAASTIYTAQLLNFASAPTSADFFTSLGDGAAGVTPVYYNRIYAKANGGQFLLGVDRNATAAIGYSLTNYDYGTTYLVVTKYDFTNGTSSMYVLSGAIPSIEPLTPDATSSGGAVDPASLTRVVIRQSTNLPLSVTYDGVRVATSWKQAVGL